MSGDDLNKLKESISMFEDTNMYDTCYMSFATFLEIFKADYNLFRFAGKWYLTHTDIQIEFRDNLPDNTKMVLVNTKFLFNV